MKDKKIILALIIVIAFVGASAFLLGKKRPIKAVLGIGATNFKPQSNDEGGVAIIITPNLVLGA